MKETPVISNVYATNISSKHVSFLCFVVCILSLSSSLFELWILILSWWSGEAFTDIYMGYLQSYPELGSYDVNFRSTRIYTVILDYMSFIPYYTALILSSIIFYRFRTGIFWDKKNINVLKLIGILVIFDSLFQPIKNTLQILAFTINDEHPIFMLFLGISSEGVRGAIVGISVYTFSVILKRAKSLDDEFSLIV